MKNLSVLTLFVGAILFFHNDSSAQCTSSNVVSYRINGGPSSPLSVNTIDLGDVYAGSDAIINFTISSSCVPAPPPAFDVRGFLDISNGAGWITPAPTCGATTNSHVSWSYPEPPAPPNNFVMGNGAAPLSFTARLSVNSDLLSAEEGIYCMNFVIVDLMGPGLSQADLVIEVSANLILPVPIISFVPSTNVTVPGGVVEEGDVGNTALTIQNIGSADLEISAFNTIEVVGNWSNFPTAPQTITPSNDILLDPIITAPTDLSVETPYRLRISVVSNDSNSPHELLFEATGQPEKSNFQIAQSAVIAFDPVEIPGMDDTKTLDLSNPSVLGIAALDADYAIEPLDASDPDWIHFTFNDGGPPVSLPISTSTLEFDDTKSFGIVFEPLDLGDFDVFIRVSSKEAGTSTFTDQQIIQITGTGTTKPIDFVLVLDKSGSMNQTAGEVVKMEAMQNATDYFLSLLLGEAENYDFVDYRFGIIQFSTNNDMLYPVTPSLADVSTSSIGDAIIEVDNLTAGGWTCIQDAMLSAEGLLSDPGNSKAVIVLTDGNETPLPSQGDCTEALPAIGADLYADDLDFFSIGLGENTNFNQGNLDQISSYGSGDGFSQVTYNLKDDNLFQLFKSYQEVFRIVSGKQGVDPTYFKEIDETLEVAIKVTSLDQNATFAFVGELPIDAYKIEIFTPGGSRIYPESDTAVIRNNNYLIFNANYEKLGISNDFVGNWKLTARIDNVKKWIKNPVFEDGSTHRMMIGSFGNSSYELETQVSEDNLLAGDPLVIRTTLKEGGIASPNATVTATVTAPNKEKYIIQLVDDGLHQDEQADDGIFGAVFTNTFKRGNYTINIESNGINRKGERISRMENFSKFIGKVTPYQKVTEPASQVYTLVLIWIVLILLVLTWFRIRKLSS